MSRLIRKLWMTVAMLCAFLPIRASEIPPDVALRLEIRNVTVGQGQILVGVCLEHEFLRANCAFQTAVPVTANPQVVMVPADSLPPGRYAVQVAYDKNVNGQLDRNALGIPVEPVGFSNGAVGRFGPPSFGQAAVRYAGAPLALAITVN